MRDLARLKRQMLNARLDLSDQADFLECKAAAIQKKIDSIRECKQCRKEFLPVNSGQWHKFCSKRCYNQSITDKR